MKHIKLEPMIAPTMSAATSSQSHSLPSAHSSPYSLPTPIASAQASPANHTGASRCSISSSHDVTTSDTHTNKAMPADANVEAVAQTNRCLVLSPIGYLPPCSIGFFYSFFHNCKFLKVKQYIDSAYIF